MPEVDLITLHFGLGMEIRNAFGLHDLCSKLLSDCDEVHPDDASGVIIKELWGNCRQLMRIQINNRKKELIHRYWHTAPER